MQVADREKMSDEVRLEREARIAHFLLEHAYEDAEPIGSPEYERLLEIRSKVFELLLEADTLAQSIRDRSKSG
ncbi:MAG TPA: hypothetical protein PKD26_11265 [Pyrinomonadaceae bacterium]|nr:hypothetical protein [Pyrinomonadaceae bacterium]